ncbi:GSCOCG00012821001-RA-CDS [Cotesia congregata]|nr:GSCOCG00012821001-RA-CDS [Cotesia congregata]
MIIKIFFNNLFVKNIFKSIKYLLNNFFVYIIIIIEASGRISKSGGSDDSASGYLQLNALNLQGSAPSISEVPGKIPIQPIAIKTVRPVGAFNAWLVQDNPGKSPGTPPALTSLKKHPPPRILEALPSYPLDSAETRLPSLSDIPLQSPDLY